MSSSRILRSLLPHGYGHGHSSRRILTSTRLANPRRHLNTDTAPVLYSAHATVMGARNGRVRGSEGLDLALSMPKALGGQGERGTNPEELFAACYGSCFQAAMNLASKEMGIAMPAEAKDSVVETTLHMVGDLEAFDLGVRVDMVVRVRGVGEKDLQRLVKRTRETCPYSRAVKGNVTTNISVEEMK
ncbi:hypothetical protein E4U55_001505 [Claviceps digitariae]|nr:hypothetical protein E4U55_001505 [Claviceps digitariae]